MSSLIIGLSSTLVGIFREKVIAVLINIPPLQEAILEAFLVTLISAPLLWLLAIRPLEKQLKAESARTKEQIRVHLEFREAVNLLALVSITDIQGNITYVNDKFCTIAGYTREELMGKNHRLIKSGYHDKQFFKQLWSNISQGKNWQGEVRNRKKNGQSYWVAASVIPLYDKDGNLSQYLSIRQEITALKENEIRLQESQLALDASNEMIFFTDTKGYIQYANPALLKFTGWKKEELLGKSPTLFHAPNTSKKLITLMQDSLSKGVPWTGRMIHRKKGIAPLPIAGQTTPANPLEYWTDINATPISDIDGKTTGYVQIQRDISAQVKNEAESTLRSADTKARLKISNFLQQPLPLKDRLDNVLATLFDLQEFDLQRKGGVFLLDKQNECLNMFVLNGQFSEEFIRREKSIPLGSCLCGRAAMSGEIIISDDCFCDPRHEHSFEGMKLHGHYIIPIINQGEILGVIFLYTASYPTQSESRMFMLSQVGNMVALALIQETTQQALAKARDTALQTAQTRSDFLSNMSHEIRTPMNGVLGMLEILKDTSLSQEQTDLMETAANSAEALLIIINDILDFSKLEAGKVEIEHLSFDILPLIEEVCALQASSAHIKNLELNCDIPLSLPRWWEGDPIRIRQVIMNLLGNAIKFTKQGEILVKTLAILTNEGQTCLRVEIIDTGIGISSAQQKRLFQPFSQVDSSTTRHFGGTGLGLSISKNLIELMGGIIGVDSTPNKGSCFWFNLPLQPSPNNIPDQPPLNLYHKKILIVDDNATNRKILEHCLSHWGVESHSVKSGADALSLLLAKKESSPFDVILLDLQMPDMDGLELSRLISQSPSIATTPRILLSSGGLGDPTELKTLGISQSLLKPVRQLQLYNALQTCLKIKTETDASSTSNTYQHQDNTLQKHYYDKRVLIAEDNLVNQKVIHGLLAKFQLNIDLANNGQLALDMYAKHTYDLIFMDCQMPVLDGFQTTQLIRERETSKDMASHLPIIALTAHATTEARAECTAAGMDDFLSKPIRPDKLAKVLERWLENENQTAPKSADKKDLKSNNKNELQKQHSHWDKSAALQSIHNDEELLHEIIEVFIECMPDQLAQLRTAIDNTDYNQIADEAHGIKGMVSSFYAEPATTLASSLEQNARLNKGDELPQLMTELTAALTDLMPALQQEMD